VKTDELIEMLGTNLEPVNGGQLRNGLLIALTVAVGTVAAICLTWCALAMPTDAQSGAHFGFKATALVFTLGLAAAGASILFRSARPGQSGRTPLVLVGLLCLTVVAAAIVALTGSDPVTSSRVVRGGPWGTCLVCIPIFAVVPFVAFIWALRKGAPTNLTLAGAIAGLVAGALGAAAMVVNQAGDSIPLIALWFGGPVALCALIGGILGPRLLRW
jgi:hypothetical protein